MATFGDTLWFGPSLQRILPPSDEPYLPDGIDSLENGRGLIYSMDIYEGSHLVAGVGYPVELDNSVTDAGMGFYLSTNSGSDWQFVEQPLESQNDTTFKYGNDTLSKVPVVVPQQSPPYDIDIYEDVIMSASWATGLLRSTDLGTSWERLLLPPTNVGLLSPNSSYDFVFDPRQDNNFLGFGLLIENDNGRVWFGSAGGVNISTNALTAPSDSVEWNHISSTSGSSNLLGNWIIAIEKNYNTGDIWMTNWPSNPNESYGLVATSDNAQTFRQYLKGYKLYDVAFAPNAIYTVGDAGLFISRDGGDTWIQKNDIRNADTFIKSGARFLSVEYNSAHLWVGTSDGLAYSSDGGETWEIRRTNMPLKGGNIFQQDTPNVSAYAYPNPFSPTQHSICRIKFKVEEQGDIKIRIFDYGMNLVKTLDKQSLNTGTYEAAWNGTDQHGLQVANGTYFYQVTGAGSSAQGKILLME